MRRNLPEMTDPREIRIEDYNYNLPDERIAKYPVAVRDTSKLLIYNKGDVSHTQFYNIADFLPEGSLMVFNNTRVIQARLHFHKTSGALIEIFCLEPHLPHDYEQMFQATGSCQWSCLIGNRKKWKEGLLERPLTIKGLHLVALHRGHGPADALFHHRLYCFVHCFLLPFCAGMPGARRGTLFLETPVCGQTR